QVKIPVWDVPQSFHKARNTPAAGLIRHEIYVRIRAVQPTMSRALGVQPHGQPTKEPDHDALLLGGQDDPVRLRHDIRLERIGIPHDVTPIYDSPNRESAPTARPPERVLFHRNL